MSEKNRIVLVQADEDDNMIRYPRQRIVDMYKIALSRIRVLEAKAKEGSICNKCDNRTRTDHAFQELLIREQCLLRKLALKEQELQDHSDQLLTMHNSIKNESVSSLKCSVQDPAVNNLIKKLHEELYGIRAKLEETQNELNAWKFTPDSNTGKRLMAKCRLLYQENEELGKVINSGMVGKVEGELAMQKNFGFEVKKSQIEMDQFLQDLDDDVESMQSTINYLQNELIKYKTAAAQTSSNTETIFIPKESDNDKDDVFTTKSISSASYSEIPTKFIRTIHEGMPYKTYSSMDMKYLKDTMSSHSKVNELKIFGTDDQYDQIERVHMCKNRSEGNRYEEKRKKSDRRQYREGKWYYKKIKSDGPKITEIQTNDEDTK